MRLADEQLILLRHTLGINDPIKAKPEPYRMYAAANLGDPAPNELVCIGTVETYSAHGGYEWFRCTSAGSAGQSPATRRSA